MPEEPTLAERLETNRSLTLAQLHWEKRFNDLLSQICIYQNSLSYWEDQFSRFARSRSKREDLQGEKEDAGDAVRRLKRDLEAWHQRLFEFCRDNPYPKEEEQEDGNRTATDAGNASAA